jgi:curved DNA binding protein
MAAVSEDATAQPAEEAENPDCSVPEVVTKYTTAGDIANRCLAQVVAALVDGASVREICAMGDAAITEATAKVYKGKKVQKGIAFPTCISANNCCGHYSPLADDTSAQATLRNGDLVKVDMGVHIDGFIALAAHTHVVGGGAIDGRKADVIAACKAAGEVVIRSVRPGNKNHDVTALIEKTVAAFGCTPVEGVVSHQVSKAQIDGEKCIMNKLNPEKRIPEVTFEMNETYVIDMVVSTGEGKARDTDTNTTVFKRTPDASYQLKLQASRQLFHDIKEKHPDMPFSLRGFEGIRGARMGVGECCKHDLLQPYPVLYEREGEFVAQIKFTVLLLPAGPLRITNHPVQDVTTDKAIEDEALLALLATEVRKPKPAKKTKK